MTLTRTPYARVRTVDNGTILPTPRWRVSVLSVSGLWYEHHSSHFFFYDAVAVANHLAFQAGVRLRESTARAAETKGARP